MPSEGIIQIDSWDAGPNIGLKFNGILSRGARRPDPAGYIFSTVAFDDGDVVLALQVEPELCPVAELPS